MRTLLFIAYYLPPMGSSGVQRPLKMLKYLPQFGWNPIVLAPETGLYHTLDPSLEAEFEALGLNVYRVPGGTPFHRGGGEARQSREISERWAKPLRWLSAFRYLPDNKVGWIGPAFEKADEIIRKHNPEVVLATSPPPSNLMLAARISQKFGLPSVFDMRDDWVGNHQQMYPTPWHRRRMAALESQTLSTASAVVAVNDTIRDALRHRNASIDASFHTVANGFDPADFEDGDKSSLPRDGHIRILYSGRFYGENQPDAFLEGVRNLIESNPELASSVRICFQGGLDSKHREHISALGLNQITEDLGYLDHRTAVANLKQADILWLVAAHRNRGEQVSTGKVFEYMAAGKPVLALAPPNGEIGALLKGYGPAVTVPPHDPAEIAAGLQKLLSDMKEGNLPQPAASFVRQFTRESLTGKLAEIIEKVVSQRSSR